MIHHIWVKIKLAKIKSHQALCQRVEKDDTDAMILFWTIHLIRYKFSKLNSFHLSWTSCNLIRYPLFYKLLLLLHAINVWVWKSCYCRLVSVLAIVVDWCCHLPPSSYVVNMCSLFSHTLNLLASLSFTMSLSFFLPPPSPLPSHNPSQAL